MSKNWTFLPEYLGKNRIINGLKRGTTLMLCCFALSACGPVASLWNDDEPPSQNQQQTQQSATMTALPDAGQDGGQTAPPMLPPMTGTSPPPDAMMKPLMPGQSGTQYTPDGLPALQPSQGIKLEELFAQDLRDPDLRMDRVENAVIDIRHDLDAVMPSIVRLVAVERDMQQLVEQLETLLRDEPPAPQYTPAAQHQYRTDAVTAPPPAPQTMASSMPQDLTSGHSTAPEASYTPPANAKSAVISGQFTVKDLRLGEHKNKTRLVMDATGKPSYRYDLDNSENLLVIEIPNAGWSGKQEQMLKKAPLVSSYTVYPMDGGGSRVVLQLKAPARVIYEGTYEPNKDNSNHRLVIDIQKM